MSNIDKNQYCIDKRKLPYSTLGALCMLMSYVLIEDSIDNEQPISSLGKIVFMVGSMIVAYNFSLNVNDKFIIDLKTVMNIIVLLILASSYAFMDDFIPNSKMRINILVACVCIFGLINSYDRDTILCTEDQMLPQYNFNIKKAFMALISTISIISGYLLLQRQRKQGNAIPQVFSFGLPLTTIGLGCYVISQSLCKK